MRVVVLDFGWPAELVSVSQSQLLFAKWTAMARGPLSEVRPRRPCPCGGAARARDGRVVAAGRRALAAEAQVHVRQEDHPGRPEPARRAHEAAGARLMCI